MSWLMLGMLIGILIGAGLMTPLAMWLRMKTAVKTRDMTEQLVQQEQLQDRMAEVSTMTGGLAHEIKNPLSTIGLNLQLLKESIGDLDVETMHKTRLETRIDSVMTESDRLRNILEDFLRYAGRIRLHQEKKDLNQLVQQLVDFYQPQAEASGIQLRPMFKSEPVFVNADESLFKQAVLNLLLNAIQAMVDSKYTDEPHGGCTDLMLRVEVTEAGAWVHVTDTGPGISEEIKERIFHPYFSNKRGGTGLGLAVTRRIVEEHGGRIEVDSEQGKGSDFRIMLPHFENNKDDSNKPCS